MLLAVGKAAPAMARGALAAVPADLDVRAVVVTADGTDARGLDADPRVRFLRAAHPIPDQRSLDAAEALLSAASRATNALALVSGGASALACAPVEGLSFADKRALMAALLDAGAPIADVNLVRRHLSRIKGGGLARAGARVVTRIVSDVLVTSNGIVTEGLPHDIGSGPASHDPTTAAEALAALSRWAPDWTARVGHLLVEARTANVVDERIVASPRELADAAAQVCHARGYDVTVAPPSLATVDAQAEEYVAQAHDLAPGSVWLRVAEPSVTLPPRRGHGGRAGRLALAVWAAGLPADVELACVSSDGVDGSSGAAGAAVSSALAGEARREALEALARFDDGPFLTRAGRSLPAAPSGNNLLDLHVLLRRR